MLVFFLRRSLNRSQLELLKELPQQYKTPPPQDGSVELKQEVGVRSCQESKARADYRNPDSERSLAIFSSSRSLGSTSKLLSYISCTSPAAFIWSRIHSWRSGTGL